MSKGSNPRPYSVSQKKFAENWDAIFKKDKNQDQQKDKEKKDELGRSN